MGLVCTDELNMNVELWYNDTNIRKKALIEYLVPLHFVYHKLHTEYHGTHLASPQ
jgi:hypothetical protein